MKTSAKNLILFPLNVLYKISPALALKIVFRIKNGTRLDLKNPTTYDQKLQWMKLHYKNPLLPKLVDKYTVRDYVAQKAPEILIPLLWQGFDANEIPWDDLPDKFVMKVSHGSSFNILCRDKSKLNREECVRKLNGWLKDKFRYCYACYGEWFYGVEKPRIVIEEFLDTGDGTPPNDFKFFCFDGKPHFVTLDTDRFVSHKKNVYDMDWNWREGVTLGLPNDRPSEKPEQLDELVKYATMLSEGFPHVRVDLYLLNGKVYFGEMTFTPGAGFDKLLPREFDLEMGSLFNIREY